MIPWPNHISFYYVLQKYRIFCHHLFGYFSTTPLLMQGLYSVISLTEILTISLLICGRGHFPLSNDCISSSENVSQGIIKLSIQSISGLGLVLEEVDNELGDRDGKDAGGPDEASIDELLPCRCLTCKNIHTRSIIKKTVWTSPIFNAGNFGHQLQLELQFFIYILVSKQKEVFWLELVLMQKSSKVANCLFSRQT